MIKKRVPSASGSEGGLSMPLHGQLPTQTAGSQIKIITETIPVGTEGNGHMVDITSDVGRLLKKQNLHSGTVTIFVQGSTASITTIEYEPGLEKDFPEAMEKVAPSHGQTYHHDQAWHDGNGHSHVRASLVGPSLTVPFSNGVMTLGRWQQIVLVDWDNRARRRDIVLQFIGVA